MPFTFDDQRFYTQDKNKLSDFFVAEVQRKILLITSFSRREGLAMAIRIALR